jgi:hypothetical protein
MRREIAVAEAEPGLAAQCFERRHEGPGLAAPAPPSSGLSWPEQRVEQRIEVGRDLETEMLEIVAGIGDYGSAYRAAERGTARAPAWRRRPRPTVPAPARDCRSSEQVVLRRTDQVGGRRIGRRPGKAAHQRDRHRLVGWPMTSEAAAAISSAKPVSVTSSFGGPEQIGMAAPVRSPPAKPAAPSAMPKVPRRNGRPKLSLMMTAMRLPLRAVSSRRRASAEESGVQRQQQHQLAGPRPARHWNGRCRHWP